MASANRQSQSVGHDRRTQAILDQAAAMLAQMQLDQTLRQQITDQIFDTTHSAVFRATHSADFIQRLIDVSPSLKRWQKRELLGIADDLIAIARQTPRDAYDQGQQMLREARRPQPPPDALDSFLAELQAEWAELKLEWAAVRRGLCS